MCALGEVVPECRLPRRGGRALGGPVREAAAELDEHVFERAGELAQRLVEKPERQADVGSRRGAACAVAGGR